MKYAFVIEPSEHAELSASSADRWTTCLGSPALIKGLPNHGSKYAAEGTAAHYIGAACLRMSWTPFSWKGQRALVEGYEIELTEELLEAVAEYLEDIHSYYESGDVEFIEHSFTEAMKKLHPKFGGSSDYVNFRARTRRLRVVDYKHGAGVSVDVDDNKQLKYYALGVLLSFPQFTAEDVEIRIAQPRCDHEQGRFRSYVFPAMELLDYAADLVAAAEATEDPFAPLVPSKKACKWCPAAAAKMCPAVDKVNKAIVQAAFQPITPDKYSAEQIAEFLAKAPLVEAHISAIREFAYQEAMHGKEFPGFKLVPKRSTRRYTDEQAVEEALSTQGLDIEDTHTSKLKSPAQMEKSLGKKRYEEIVAPFVDKSSSGYTLVPTEDTRPAVLPQEKVLSLFAPVEQSPQ